MMAEVTTHTVYMEKFSMYVSMDIMYVVHFGYFHKLGDGFHASFTFS